MGYYIETDGMKNKAQWLLQHEARIESGPYFNPSSGRIGICVVDNGPFEAAAIAYSENECKEFARPDGRSKIWLSMPKDMVIKLQPRVAKILP